MTYTKQLDELRRNGQYGKFLDLLQQLYGDVTLCDEADAAFGRHFLAGIIDGTPLPCLLLEAAFQKQPTAEFFSGDGADPMRDSPLWDLWPPGAIRELLRGRLRLIEAAQSHDSTQKISDLLRQAAERYRRAWGNTPGPSGYVAGDPAFLLRLPANSHWGSVLRQFERQFHPDGHIDWDEPLLLMGGETIVYLLAGHSALSCEGRPVSTWVPLQARMESLGNSSVVPEGLLGRLVVEKVPDGGGYLYPDCRFNGYLPLDALFQEALRNVMTVIRRRPEWPELKGPTFDFRWRLIPTSPLDGHLNPVPLDSLTGRSAELAFAAAVMAALKGERLDERAAISACFAEPAVHDELMGVDGLIDKVLGTRTERPDASPLGGQLKGNLIDHLVVSDETTSQDAFQVHGWTIEINRAKTFDQAYRILSEHCRITDKVKQHLAERSRRLLEETCTPYVRSSLSTRRPGDPSKQEPREVREPLPPEKVEQMLRGNLGEKNRVRLLAESGLGKSTMLIEAEHLIASTPGSLVPLRLGAGPACTSHDDRGRWNRLPLLSDFDWSQRRDDLLDQLAERLLGEVIEDGSLRSAWIREAVARGEVVFLLDSLDQTEDRKDGKFKLDRFLKSAGVRNCPVLLSMRPEARFSKSSSQAGITWRTLWLDSFNRERIRRYWGETPLLERLLNDEWAALREVPLILRLNARGAGGQNPDWAALREVPILLQQMKRLAEWGELENLPNREAIYHRTLLMLLQHGHAGLEDAGHFKVSQNSLPRVEKLLAKIAWETITLESSSQHKRDAKFTGELSGYAYVKFEEEHSNLLHTLDQLSLTIRQAYIDKLGYYQEQFAWRHFSFCEWFAAQHFVSLASKHQEAVIQKYALDERWKWIFRFAVCAASRLGQQETVGHLAKCFLSYGAAFLLWEVIDDRHGDGVDLANSHRAYDSLCRWLVDKWDASWPPRSEMLSQSLFAPESYPVKRATIPVVTGEIAEILKILFELDEKSLLPKFRDSRWLYPAWQLVIDGCDSADASIRNICMKLRFSFLTEYERRVEAAAARNQSRQSRDWRSEDRGLLQLVPDEHLVTLDLINEQSLKTIRQWPGIETGDYATRRETFNRQLQEIGANYCQCPPEGWDHPYRTADGSARNPQDCMVSMGSVYVDDDGNLVQLQKHRLVDGYKLLRTPVTHAHFYNFDPFHFRRVSVAWPDSSDVDLGVFGDYPVHAVNWFQAAMFCIWLTGRGTFGQFDLPNRLDWEACCRAGRDRLSDFYGIPWSDKNGPILDDNGDEQFGLLGSHSANVATGAISAVGQFPGNGFGLRDMHGQVWEWMKTTEKYFPLPQRPKHLLGLLRMEQMGGSSMHDVIYGSGDSSSCSVRTQNPEIGSFGDGFRVCHLTK